MAELKSITIAGGGLAGLSLGLGLRRHGVPVVVREAGRYPRHRVCGEFISGLRDPVIEALGMDGVFDDALSLRSTSWYVRDRRVLRASLPEPARSISRFRLDSRLGELLRRHGGELVEGSRVKAAGEEGLVWCAGRRLYKDSEWLGLKAHVSGYRPDDELEMHAGSGAYLGITPVEDGYVNVCGLFRRRPGLRGTGPALMMAYLRESGLDQLAGTLESATVREGSFSGVSAISFGRQPRPADACALGDAEWMIPPFTGNGMTMAFESAEVALPHLLRFSAGEAGWRAALDAIHAGLRRRFKDRMRIANTLHPFLYTRPGQMALSLASKTHLLPFKLLYRTLR